MLGRKAVTESIILPPGIEEERPRVPYYWAFMKVIDQTPYVLSSGAVDKNWLPPKGISALPKAIRKNIPDRLKFWKLDRKDALAARKELSQMEELNIQLRIAVKSNFIFQHHWWRGQIVIRFGPSSEHWDLRIQKDSKIWHLVLKNNPLDGDSVMGYEKPCSDPEAMEKGKKGTEELKPGTDWNPTKDTPAFIKALDFGDCTILEDADLFKKVEFKGKKLIGFFTFTREDPDSDFWIVSKANLTRIESSFSIEKGGIMSELSIEEAENQAAEATETPSQEAAEAVPEEAIQALKDAFKILSSIKEKCSELVKHAIDVLAGAAGYGYPEPEEPGPSYPYPRPRYPKPYEKGEYPKPVSEDLVKVIKDALALLKPFKAQYSAQVKYAVDVLAGAAGYGYPEPMKFEAFEVSPAVLNNLSHILEVTIIRPGQSLATREGKPVFYSDLVLQDSLPLWDGATAFCDHFNKSIKNIAGVYFSPWWDNGVKAKLRVLDDDVYKFLCQLISDKDADLPVPDVGISADIDVTSLSEDDKVSISEILKVNSADIVFSPAAGGSFDRVLNAAGISPPPSNQNKSDAGSPPVQSAEELVPASRVRDLQSAADKLRANFKRVEAVNIKLQQELKDDTTKYKEALLKANPEVPEELIHGSSVEELDQSVIIAQAVVEKIKSRVEETSRIPSGAPVRSGANAENMSSHEKIIYGLQQSRQ